MADAEDVKAALAEALKDDTAESQTGKPADSDVAQALADALGNKADEGKGTLDNELDKKSTDDEGKGAKTVPYERFSEVVAQKNELAERIQSLDEKFEAAKTSNTEFQGKIQGLEEKSQILDAIKELHKDERYRDHVVAIDRALQGLEEEVVVAEKQGDDKAASGAEKRFDEKVAELETMQADQRAEGLWREAAGHAKDMLADLPEEYTEADRVVIGKLWTPRVDWNSIEEAGSESIPTALNSSFAKVIKEYGTPRGALVAQTTKEIEARIPESKLISNEDALKALTEKDWSETDKDGKAVVSDDDFNRGLSEMMRRIQTPG